MSGSTQAQLTLVAVVDNLLCIIARESRCTLFLDASALFFDDSQMMKQVVEVISSREERSTGIYDERQVVVHTNRFFDLSMLVL